MLTLRNKIGQMLIMGFSGSELHESCAVAQWLSQDGLGGVILFDKEPQQNHEKNLINLEQIKHLNYQLNHYSWLIRDEVNPLPLFIGIDYEGGAINRLAHIDDCFTTLSACELAKKSPEEIEIEVRQMAETLKFLGFNLNFAPVIDLNLQQEQGIIGALGRSYSADPHRVIELARTFVAIFGEYDIASCYKHFPGHGSALEDTHELCVDVTDTYCEEELIPYRELIKEENIPAMIMSAHVMNRHLDADGLPASLSDRVLNKLLRKDLGYQGVVVCDDLQMQAITQRYSMDEALKLAINAGTDMLIFANQWAKVDALEVIERIERLVLEEHISLERIEEAYSRIARLKNMLVLNNRSD